MESPKAWAAEEVLQVEGMVDKEGRKDRFRQ